MFLGTSFLQLLQLCAAVASKAASSPTTISRTTWTEAILELQREKWLFTLDRFSGLGFQWLREVVSRCFRARA